jgi:hypothetical protein
VGDLAVPGVGDVVVVAAALPADGKAGKMVVGAGMVGAGESVLLLPLRANGPPDGNSTFGPAVHAGAFSEGVEATGSALLRASEA